MYTAAADIRLLKGFFSPWLAAKYFEETLGFTHWHRVLKSEADGADVPLKRGMAYASTSESDYRYAGLILPGQGWSIPLSDILTRLEAKTEFRFNSVLLNHYKNGKEKIGWHSDKESQLGANPVIATVNLGAARHFHFRPREVDAENPGTESVLLESGDVLLMLENCQANHQHAILVEKEVALPRISLTYRLTL